MSLIKEHLRLLEELVLDRPTRHQLENYHGLNFANPIYVQSNKVLTETYSEQDINCNILHSRVLCRSLAFHKIDELPSWDLTIDKSSPSVNIVDASPVGGSMSGFDVYLTNLGEEYNGAIYTMRLLNPGHGFGAKYRINSSNITGFIINLKGEQSFVYETDHTPSITFMYRYTPNEFYWYVLHEDRP